MLAQMTDNWWVFTFRGVLGILFGLCAFAWPGLTAAVLIVFLGAWFFVDGIFGLLHAFRSERYRGLNLVYGAVSVLAGVAIMAEPIAAAVAVAIVIGIWAILKGVLEILAAVRLRHELEGEWFLALAGAVSVLFGAVIILCPAAGLMAIVWLLGLYAILFGLLLTALGAKLKKQKDSRDRAGPELLM